jgi:hypothetical protein
MTAILAALAIVGAVIVWGLTAFAGKLVSDELRARADALPAFMVEVALRMLRPEMRDYHRPEWEDDLAAFCAANDRFPGTKFVKSFKFAAGIVVRAGGIRWETRGSYRRGKHDEAGERLASAEPAFATVTTTGGQVNRITITKLGVGDRRSVAGTIGRYITIRNESGPIHRVRLDADDITLRNSDGSRHRVRTMGNVVTVDSENRTGRPPEVRIL